MEPRTPSEVPRHLCTGGEGRLFPSRGLLLRRGDVAQRLQAAAQKADQADPHRLRSGRGLSREGGEAGCGGGCPDSRKLW